ncbi:MAG: hypothetical protein LBD41_04940 [Clostridiales Family XIII bacterium]|jgi:hypothetical protein|nr:hypothetical protein [Clostridiales Family XIII bacterium]
MKSEITIDQNNWKTFVESLDLENIETQLENSRFWEEEHGYKNNNAKEHSDIILNCSKAITEFRYIRNVLEDLMTT